MYKILSVYVGEGGFIEQEGLSSLITEALNQEVEGFMRCWTKSRRVSRVSMLC